MATAQELQAWFAYVDSDRSGYIEANELQRALQMGGVKLDLSACRKVIALMDEDGNAQLDFKEYCKLHQFLVRMHQSFQYFDRDRSGSLDMREAYEAVRYAGFNIGWDTFSGIFALFDADGSRSLDYPEYITLSTVLESSMQAYKQHGVGGGETFDQMMQSATKEAAHGMQTIKQQQQRSAGAQGPQGYPGPPPGYGAHPPSQGYPQHSHPQPHGHHTNTSSYSSHPSKAGYEEHSQYGVHAHAAAQGYPVNGGSHGAPPPGYPGSSHGSQLASYHGSSGAGNKFNTAALAAAATSFMSQKQKLKPSGGMMSAIGKKKGLLAGVVGAGLLFAVLS